MWYKQPWFKKLRNRAIAVFVIALVLFLIYRNVGGQQAVLSSYHADKANQYMQALTLSSESPKTESMSYDGSTWYLMSKQSSGSLWMEPSLGQIAVKTSSGFVWLSSPSKEDQMKDTTKGLWKNNENSPFLLTYIEKEKQIEETVNVVDSGAKIAWQSINNGVGIRYSMTKLGFELYVEYTFDDNGFVVHVPENGVIEGNQNQIINLSVLPFFGATLSHEDGYLFVPDRSGGLIKFDQHRADLTIPYDFPVYGYDQSIPMDQFYREDIDYPVFGMKRGDQGFISIIEEGNTKANIVGMPALLKTDFNNVYAKFKWRNFYAQQQGLNEDNTKKIYEVNLNASPLTIRYQFLEQGDTDYVAMAKKYRSYLIDKLHLTTKPGPEDPPLMLDFIMAASEQPTPLGAKVVVVTTFSQVQAIVDDLYASGVHQMRVSLRGWQNGGYAGSLPKRFPVESALGGNAGLKDLQADLQKKQIPLSLDDDLMVGINKLGNGFSIKSDTVRQIGGKVIKNYQNGDYYNAALYYYLISPKRVVEKYLPKAMSGWKKLSITGVNLIDENGDGLFSDYNKSNFTDRQAAAAYMNQIYDTIHNEIGWVATNKPYSFTIGHVDHMYDFPVGSNYDLIISEQVPFYSIVLHGLVSYASKSSNLRLDPQTEFLRDIEYGTLPYFTLTDGDVRDLRRTQYAPLISGQYTLLKKEILAEYQNFVAAGKGVWNQLIEGHRQVTAGVYETSYENGIRIVVNYNEQPYQGEGYEVKGLSYTVLSGGDKK
ncbi:hypothetical protein Back11_16650 [Paenibacillus baekrokdamisoli]|uniref:Uncharacterized protein n=1 Tax=Paenibacillus baekrokdamisoli TaxID=1712516 RepID=A0A3G9IN99_9BACL|nr:DUF5696 domain-containing protein [Paenibacillus baekrokdamisoli]MBB3072018.1 hypothetical protein [Paenibacillus baekrokdamisoli]BBH20320.1 hypothetical protein Back11_16650 [Paenibacillus baekrokdamisoli]